MKVPKIRVAFIWFTGTYHLFQKLLAVCEKSYFARRTTGVPAPIIAQTLEATRTCIAKVGGCSGRSDSIPNCRCLALLMDWTILLLIRKGFEAMAPSAESIWATLAFVVFSPRALKIHLHLMTC